MAAEAMGNPGQQRLDGARGSQAPLNNDLERQGTVLVCMSSCLLLPFLQTWVCHLSEGLPMFR